MSRELEGTFELILEETVIPARKILLLHLKAFVFLIQQHWKIGLVSDVELL